MRAGRKKQTIEVQSRSDQSDAFGDEIEVYTKVFRAKCNFRVVSGIDLVKSGMEMSREYATILMNMDNRLKHEHLIKYKSEIYDIESIKPDDRNRDVVVTVSRLV